MSAKEKVAAEVTSFAARSRENSVEEVTIATALALPQTRWIVNSKIRPLIGRRFRHCRVAQAARPMSLSEPRSGLSLRAQGCLVSDAVARAQRGTMGAGSEGHHFPHDPLPSCGLGCRGSGVVAELRKPHAKVIYSWLEYSSS